MDAVGRAQAIVVYRVGGEVYCSDAESTAFKFPLSNAKIITSNLGDAHRRPCSPLEAQFDRHLCLEPALSGGLTWALAACRVSADRDAAGRDSLRP